MTDDTSKLQELQVFQRELAKQNFADACNVVLDRGPSFNVHDMNYLTENLKKGKKNYLKSVDKKDKKSQSMIMNELSAAEKNWDQIKDFRKGVAIAAQDADYGITEDFKVSTQGQEVAAILTGALPPTVNTDGTYGFEMTNPATGNKRWMSLRNVGALVRSQSFDKNSKQLLNSMAQSMIDLSRQEGAGEFDYEAWRRKVRTNIVDRGNIRSLTYDKHLDESFFNNTVNSINGVEYKKMGIPKEGAFDEVQSRELVNRLLQDRDNHVNYLTDYYTKFLASNWKPKNKKENNTKGIVTRPNGRKLWQG